MGWIYLSTFSFSFSRSCVLHTEIHLADNMESSRSSQGTGEEGRKKDNQNDYFRHQERTFFFFFWSALCCVVLLFILHVNLFLHFSVFQFLRFYTFFTGLTCCVIGTALNSKFEIVFEHRTQLLCFRAVLRTQINPTGMALKTTGDTRTTDFGGQCMNRNQPAMLRVNLRPTCRHWRFRSVREYSGGCLTTAEMHLDNFFFKQLLIQP